MKFNYRGYFRSLISFPKFIILCFLLSMRSIFFVESNVWWLCALDISWVQGKQSSDEEELDGIPDDDAYDTEDSFIDDADLVGDSVLHMLIYFRVTNPLIYWSALSLPPPFWFSFEKYKLSLKLTFFGKSFIFGGFLFKYGHVFLIMGTWHNGSCSPACLLLDTEMGNPFFFWTKVEAHCCKCTLPFVH